jgi:phosphoglycolate phosphatase-like HAD superfamily hydrolase
MALSWIFLDLDGTLVDVARRYHRLHGAFVVSQGCRPLRFADYWPAKRERVPEPELMQRAGLSPEAADWAATSRLRWIEDQRYLRLDRPWSWTVPVLDDLARRAPLVLVTLRRYPDLLHWQLGRLGLTPYFQRVLAGRSNGKPEAKARLIRKEEFPGLERSVFVGDTEVDIASGQALGIRTVAVASGLRTTAHLAAWNPDALFEDLREVPSWLDSLD